MRKPLVSIVMPVCNAEVFLEESIGSLLASPYRNWELICVDDCSDDDSASAIERYAESDHRIRLLKTSCRSGAGAARNLGFSRVSGEYVLFLDADDVFGKDLLPASVKKAVKTGADLTVFSYRTFGADGKESSEGLHAEWIPPGTEVFSWRDIPNRILSALPVAPWCKLYRTAFLRENGLRFDEITSTNDVAFAAVCVAKANRITWSPRTLIRYRVGHSGTVTGTKSAHPENMISAMLSAEKQLRDLLYFEQIRMALCRYLIENSWYYLKHYLIRGANDQAEIFYSFLRQYYSGDLFWDVDRESLGSELLYLVLDTIRDTPWDTFRKTACLSVTAILIGAEGTCDGKALIGDQSWMPDEVRRAESIRSALIAQGKEELLVVIPYGSEMDPELVESLVLSAMRYPRAVSADAVDLIAAERDGRIMERKDWIPGTGALAGVPSLQLLARADGAAAYPPGLVPEESLSGIPEGVSPDEESLYLKAAEILSGVPTVLRSKEREYRVRRYNGTAELRDIAEREDLLHGKGTFAARFTDPSAGALLLGAEAVSAHAGWVRRKEEQQFFETAKELEIQKEEERAVRASLSFRLGQFFTWIPRLIRGAVRNARSSNSKERIGQ